MGFVVFMFFLGLLNINNIGTLEMSFWFLWCVYVWWVGFVVEYG